MYSTEQEKKQVAKYKNVQCRTICAWEKTNNNDIGVLVIIIIFNCSKNMKGPLNEQMKPSTTEFL